MKTLMAAILMASPAFADEARDEALRRMETLKVSVDFTDMRLAEAVEYVRELTGINFVILPKVAEKDPEAKVTLKVRELSVKSVLKLMLASRGLVATWRDGAVVILPREDLQDSVTMRMFDVRSLLVKIQDFQGPKVELAPATGHVVDTIFAFPEEPRPVMEESFLIDLVKDNTGSDSWSSNPRTALNLVNGMMGVSQSPGVIREIEQFLSRLGR